ncbi:MAG: SagB family peptide dehydrogenase [Desulfurococcaceae archaeon]
MDIDKHSFIVSSPMVSYNGFDLDKMLPRIDLPKPLEPERLGSFGKVVLKSAEIVERFKESPTDAIDDRSLIDLKVLSTVLFYSFAVLSVKKLDEGIIFKKSYEPPTRFHNLTLWIYPRRVRDLPMMLYKYNDKEHSLHAICKVGERPMSNLFARSLGVNSWIYLASVLIFIIANINDAISYFGSRGLRYLLIEVGEVLQNIRLVATAVGLRTASTSAFVDDFINQSLNVDYPNFAVMSIVGLGAQS